MKINLRISVALLKYTCSVSVKKAVKFEDYNLLLLIQIWITFDAKRKSIHA